MIRDLVARDWRLSREDGQPRQWAAYGNNVPSGEWVHHGALGLPCGIT